MAPRHLLLLGKFQRKHSSQAYFSLWKSGSLLGCRSSYDTIAVYIVRLLIVWIAKCSLPRWNHMGVPANCLFSVPLAEINDTLNRGLYHPLIYWCKNSQCLWKGSAYPCLQWWQRRWRRLLLGLRLLLLLLLLLLLKKTQKIVLVGVAMSQGPQFFLGEWRGNGGSLHQSRSNIKWYIMIYFVCNW